MRIVESELSALGRSLCPISTNLIKLAETNANKRRVWYQGSEPYFDLQLETFDGKITRLQITLRGNVLSWRSPDYLQTGETNELDVPPDVAYYPASETIRDGAAINWSLVKSMKTMLSNRQDGLTLTQVRQLLTAQLQHHRGLTEGYV
ncbi:MAG: hypothetical protein AAF892_03485 [Cyanobacteria bacterium P01_D01_bin.71]